MTATSPRQMQLPEGITTIADTALGADLGDGTLSFFASLHRNPTGPATELIEVECHGRPRLNSQGEKLTGRIPCATKDRFRVMRIFSTSTACDDCRNAYLDDMRLAGCRSYWEATCPADIRATDVRRDDFPGAIYKSLLPYTGTESLFLYGPSGSGKTRVAAMLLKRAMLAGRDVAILWPEELKDAAQSRFDRLKLLRGFAAREVLMMDDSLMTGAQDEKITDFLRDLIDLLMRNGNRFLITSQVGEADYTQAADKYGKATTADRERIAAIFRRIKERCRVIPFAPGVAVTPTTEF